MLITSDRNLYLAEDKRTVVEEGDLRSAFLLVIPGSLVSEVDAQYYGLTLAENGTIETPEQRAKRLEPEPPANNEPANNEPPASGGASAATAVDPAMNAQPVPIQEPATTTEKKKQDKAS